MKQSTNVMIKKIAKVLVANDVVKAGLFGSYARGEETVKSDIDILVKFKGRKSYFDLVTLEEELQKLTDKKVDLLTYNAVHPLLKKSILEDEVTIL